MPVAVSLLLISVGMSLRWSQALTNAFRLGWQGRLRLLVATFLVPPALALALSRIFNLDKPALAGLFLIGVVPGAPLMIRGIGKKGFDSHLAASYQVWGAALTPVIVPLVVLLGGKLYGRDIWVDPVTLLIQILKVQFVPLLAGFAFTQFAPALANRAFRPISLLGGLLLALAIVLVLVKLGPALLETSPWVLLAAFLLACGCIAVVPLTLPLDRSTVLTLAACNANRHVGLAVLMSGLFLNLRNVVPAIACYVIASQIAMLLFARRYARTGESPEPAPPVTRQ